jgi:large subunit ribosomal protein L23
MNLKKNLNLYDVIIAPIVTEKSTLVQEKGNQVFFKVRKDALKKHIKSAVSKIFNVEVESVNTLILKGKKKRFRGRSGQRSDYKKAMVRLKDGHSIDFSAGS